MSSKMPTMGKNVTAVLLCTPGSGAIRHHTIFSNPGINPYNLPMFSHFALQITALSTFPRLLHFGLRYLGQAVFISHIIGGLLFGPSVLGHIEKKLPSILYPPKSHAFMETAALFGSMFYLFRIGVQTDLTMLMKAGKKAWAIGICCYGMANFFGKSMASFTNGSEYNDAINQKVSDASGLVVKISSMTCFPVVASALSDLNLLNSELGRLALSSSMVADLTHFVIGTVLQVNAIRHVQNQTMAALSSLSLVGLCLFIFYVVRLFPLWVIRRTPEGQQLKQFYVTCIFAIVSVTGLMGEVIGQSALRTSLYLGLMIPDGPPLGSALVEKLDGLPVSLLMPLSLAVLGLQINLSTIDPNYWSLQFSIGACVVGKMVGVALASRLFTNIEKREALLLGLIMNVKGIVELSMLNVFTEAKNIELEASGVMLISYLIITALFTPIVKFFYDPSRRYLTNKKRSILHMKPDSEFSMVVCIHSHEDVPPVLKLLETSNSTQTNPLKVYVLHLVELVGRAAPVVINHHKRKAVPNSSTNNPSKIDQVVNAFAQFEQQKDGVFHVYPFTAVSPYITMHSDILTMAVDTKVSIIIFPFHLACGSGGSWNVSTTKSHSLRTLFRNVLDLAPCSIGILVDRNHRVIATPLHIQSRIYRVVVFFLGGDDDREALAYAMLMDEHPNVHICLVRFLPSKVDVHDSRYEEDILHDNKVVDSFMSTLMYNHNKSRCVEKKVKDGEEMMRVMQSMMSDFDLFIVGRRQPTDASKRLVSGLEEWKEYEELGIIGDVLASSDLNQGSILVVQQAQGSDRW